MMSPRWLACEQIMLPPRMEQTMPPTPRIGEQEFVALQLQERCLCRYPYISIERRQFADQNRPFSSFKRMHGFAMFRGIRPINLKNAVETTNQTNEHEIRTTPLLFSMIFENSRYFILSGLLTLRVNQNPDLD